jgi:antitoxin component YwqK of YwqJK toxin-antitoxin module
MQLIPNTLSSLIIPFASLFAMGQHVLDAPFIMEKEHLFVSQPEVLNWQVRDYYYNLPDSQIKSKLVYPSSFLFAEHEYTRMRVMRYIPFNKNKAFADSVVHIEYSLGTTGLWEAIEAGKNHLSSKKSLHRKDFYIHLRKRAMELDGLNTNDFIDLPNYTVQAQSLLNNISLVSDLSQFNGSKIDTNGIFRIINYYYPKEFEIISFAKMIKHIILNGECTAFTDIDFSKSLTIEEVKKLLGGDNPLLLSGLRLKEDYYIHPLTGKLTSSIIGIGLVGEDRVPGNELLWIYHPELGYAMQNYCTYFDGTIVNYAYLLEYHFFNETIESMINIGSVKLEDFYELDNRFAVKLEALVQTSIRLEHLKYKGEKLNTTTFKFAPDGALLSCKFSILNEIPNGEIEFYYPEDRLYLKGSMEAGVCQGEFNYYYTSGKLRATRNFNNNQLAGIQKNYWPNGQLYSTYEIAGGNIQALTRYYEDGELLEKGNFEDGIQIGMWEYQIRCTPEIAKNIIDAQNNSMAPFYNGKDTYKYKVNYSMNGAPGCYFTCWKYEIVE